MAELQAAGVAFTHLDTAATLAPVTSSTTANAYLGGWGIAAALAAGADIVVCRAGHRRVARGRPGGVVARMGATTTGMRSPARSSPVT